jgi:hypothetical protein
VAFRNGTMEGRFWHQMTKRREGLLVDAAEQFRLWSDLSQKVAQPSGDRFADSPGGLFFPCLFSFLNPSADDRTFAILFFFFFHALVRNTGPAVAVGARQHLRFMATQTARRMLRLPLTAAVVSHLFFAFSPGCTHAHTLSHARHPTPKVIRKVFVKTLLGSRHKLPTLEGYCRITQRSNRLRPTS